MKRYRAALALLVILAVVVGCAIIDYRPDPERSTYLMAKTTTYGLWRSGGVSLDSLRAAKPLLEALEGLLEANDEVALDATLGKWLTDYAAALPLAADRRLLGDLVAATLDAFRLQNPVLLSDTRKEVALWIVGGILDGIGYAEEAATEGGG